MTPKLFETTDSTYSSVSVIGEGGSGIVYKVKNTEGESFALKVLKIDERTSKEKIKRFKNEIAFCNQNHHPNIVNISDSGFVLSENGLKRPFYVMPLFESSLRHLIEVGIEHKMIPGLFSQVLNGVEAAHLKRVFHRDIKPENILYKKPTNELVIADFGIAHFTDEELLTIVETKQDSKMANFQYAAPEQRKRGGTIDNRTDIYALGLILNELFTDEIPQGTKFKTIGSVSLEFQYLDEIVETMINQSKENRPSSIEEVKKIINTSSNLYIANQKISKLDLTVIPSTQIDDPIIADPIRIIDYDWDENTEILTLVLSQSVNSKWKTAFLTMGSHASLRNKGPDLFNISGNLAQVHAQEMEIQSLIDYFKSWLPKIAIRYESIIKAEIQEKENAYLRQIQEEKARAERKKRVLEKTHI